MRTIRAALLVALAAALSACATTRAATPSERPALDVPVPPPRVIAPLPVEPQAPMVEPVEGLPGSNTSVPSKPRPQRDRDTSKPPEAKPDEKPAEQTATPAPVAPPVPQLRIPETGDQAQLAQQIRDIIKRTRDILNSINYQQLTQQLRKAYDDSKLFADQAEAAVKANNLVFAKELAEKGERLAKEIPGR